MDFVTGPSLRGAAFLLLWFLLLPLPLPAKAKTRKAPLPDGDYIAALAAANQFLHAWQAQDHEAGLVMLADEAKHATSEDRLQNFFSPVSGTRQAFEIGRGKKLKPGRYSFPVTLLQTSPGHAPQRRFSHIIVTRAGKDDWAVDKLP
jgi:hypothetical protein